MLNHLSITNYAIIESLEFSLSEKFTVITGETGAGKSILLGALSLILGNRSDTSVLNNKDKKCIIEGEFYLSKEKYLPFFKKNDLDFESSTIIRREISSSGKSRAFINDTPVSLVILRKLTSTLVDIHSQHETLQIKNNHFQIKVLDSFCKINEEVKKYKIEYEYFNQLQKELKTLIDSSLKASEDVDYLSFQVNEIAELNIKPNEKEIIEDSLKVANNAEEIKKVLELSINMLLNSDESIVQSLKKIADQFGKISDYSDEYTSYYKRLNSLSIEIEDLASDINNVNDNFDFDAENLSYLNERLSSIYSIEQKHKLSSTQQILDLFEELKIKLGNSNSFDERIEKQTETVNLQKEKILDLAQKISIKRKKGINQIEKEVVKYLSELGMPDASFKLDMSTLEEPNVNGIDKVDFLFSANKGFKPEELNKVASGGELSRLMLVIKMFLSQGDKISTILFDEIDTGVSGDIADKMADLMKKIANDTQVVAITHLPQVAAKGEVHLKILKQINNNKTTTNIINLNKEDRIEELAKMLSGKELTSAALDNAKVLLNN